MRTSIVDKLDMRESSHGADPTARTGVGRGWARYGRVDVHGTLERTNPQSTRRVRQLNDRGTIFPPVMLSLVHYANSPLTYNCRRTAEAMIADRIIWAASLPRIPVLPPPAINNGPPSLYSDCVWGCWQQDKGERSGFVDAPLNHCWQFHVRAEKLP